MSFVYFIETADHQFVKIGFSTRVFKRHSELGTLRPTSFDLRLIGAMPGTRKTERWLHGKFAQNRDNGEWFKSSPDLRSFIDAIGLIQPVATEEVEESACPPEKEDLIDFQADLECRRVSRRSQKTVEIRADRRSTFAGREAKRSADSITLQEHMESIASSGGKARAEKLSPARKRAIGKKGGKAGGKARAAALTSEERARIARKAAEKRWGKNADL